MKKGRTLYEGKYARCLACERRGNGCNGPRTGALNIKEWCLFMHALKEYENVSNSFMAEATALSEKTIEKIMSGNASPDISRITIQSVEGFFFGTGEDWPCPYDNVVYSKEIEYIDRPELLELLSERGVQVERLRQHLDDLKQTMEKEIATVRQEYEDDVVFYKDQIRFYKDQILRKDSIIENLMNSKK